MGRIDDTNLSHLWKKIVAYVNSRTGNVEPKILWSGGQHMDSSQTITLSEPISKQNKGVLLVFSYYGDEQVYNVCFNQFFVDKTFTSNHNGSSSLFQLTTDNFAYIGTKKLYISDQLIVGDATNIATGAKNGITYNNSAFVLRYVIGV